MLQVHLKRDETQLFLLFFTSLLVCPDWPSDP